MDKIRHLTIEQRQMHPRTMKTELGWDKPKTLPSYDTLLNHASVLYWQNRKPA